MSIWAALGSMNGFDFAVHEGIWCQRAQLLRRVPLQRAQGEAQVGVDVQGAGLDSPS